MEAVKTKRTWSSGFVLSVIAVFVVGIMAGLAIYTFIYAKGYSYLSSDPDVCINCHADLTDDMRHIAQGAGDNDVFDCIRCHSGVGHD